MTAIFAFGNLYAGRMMAPDSLSADFSLPDQGCANEYIWIYYTGNAPVNATYIWTFADGIPSGATGQGPHVVRWETVGMKTVSLTVQWEQQTAFSEKQIHIMPFPAMFHMTGGGSYPPGGEGVHVGLSGSETGVKYKLRRGAEYTGIYLLGTGQAIDFGLQTVPGSYNCLAMRLEGCDSIREMEGEAVVTIGGSLPGVQHICMVTFDTVAQKNQIIWNKIQGEHLSQFNIYKETYQNNVFEKIAEIPYSEPGIYTDMNSEPLVKSDKYKMTVSDSAGFESEKSPFHKTLHLNINPGIYGFNLIWNPYEGFEFKTYKIHRKTATNPWELIDSVASNVTSYTDFYTSSGLTTYYVEVLRLEHCHPYGKGFDYGSVISNYATSAPLGVEEDKISGIMIFPNPGHERVFISIPDRNQLPMTLEIYRPDGRKFFERTIQTRQCELDISGFSDGLYILKIKGRDSVFLRKFFKN